ncbi:MAG: D-alanyl-D-alanine carboxypeptidase/D-alanyl-D-alanine-endopeptidase [Microcoleaceae cyanobacterium]
MGIRWRFIAISLIIVVSLAASMTPGQTQELICSSQLKYEIEAIINVPQFQRSRWGILIEPLGSSTPLYALDANHYFTAASTVKLFTTAVALHELGAAKSIRTSIYGDNRGNLFVVGRGDPSLTETQLQDLAQQLKRKGITQVNHLYADNSYFSGAAIDPSWEWEDIQAGYGAPINSLILNQNSLDLILTPQAMGQPLKVTWVRPQQGNGWQIDNQSITVAKNQPEFVEIGRDLTQPLLHIGGQLRVGSQPEPVYAAVLDPAENFIEGLKESLKQAEIEVLQSSIIQSISMANLKELALVESPPISELIKQVNLESNNVFAGALLQTLGIRKNPQDTVTGGLNQIQETLEQWGINSESYVLVDGSGLSRQNWVSPAALVQILQVMATLPQFELYKNSLPVAGVSGTLKKRFLNTSTVGIISAKTGTLTGVSALAGYINPPHSSPLVFSIILNQSNQSTRKSREAIDRILLRLADLQSC